MTAQELVAQGCKSGSVYKAQWEMRQTGKLDHPRAEAAVMHQNTTGPPQSIDRDYIAKLETDNSDLLNEVMELSKAAEEGATLQDQLEQAQARIGALEAEAREARNLRERVKALQQEIKDWQRKAEAAQTARAQAEQRAEQVATEKQALMPLTVWNGHPCCVCGEPMEGIVERETAVRLLQNTGHKECLQRAGRRKVHLADFYGKDKDKRATTVADFPEGSRGGAIKIAP